MTDTSVTTEAPAVTTTPAPAPLPNNTAARSPTGEILDQSSTQPKDPSLTPPKPADGTSPPPASTDSTQPAKAADPKAVPEKYEFKAPDNIAVDPKLVEAITPIFKEAGITAEVGQKLFDFHVKALQDAAKAPTEAVEKERNAWRVEVNADPDLAKATSGGKTGLEAVKYDIGRALSNLQPGLQQKFKDVMNFTGIGDNPTFVKAFWELSQLVTEGKHVAGTNPSPLGMVAPGASAKPSAASAMYPKLA